MSMNTATASEYVTRRVPVVFRLEGQMVGRKRVEVRVPRDASPARVKQAVAEKALQMVVVWA